MSLSIKELAKNMDVSMSTVSRALSGKEGVSEAKRKLIMAEARKQGYKPDSMASSLRTGKGQGVTLIVAQNGPEVMLRRNHLLFEMAKKAFGSIRVVVVGSSNLNDEIWNAVAERTRAVVLTFKSGELLPEIRKLLNDRKIPLTAVDCMCDGFDSVLIDRAAGTYQAARMLLLCGCKNPVFYSTAPVGTEDSRMRGIVKAFQSLGKSPSEINISRIQGWSGDSKGGVSQAEKVLSSQSVDGIFCYNDLMAIGTMRVLMKAGLRVPENVRVIGFDDIPIVEALPISLTSVAQPGKKLVRAAIDLTLDKMDNFDRPPKDIIFPSSLVVRESSPITDNSLRNEIFAKADFK